MRVQCEYCGNFLSDTDQYCQSCGAVNAHMQRSATGVPKTIEELKAFAESQNLPLKEMRFFLGVDYREPRAFGIYQDAEGNFVVYKNKDNGARAIRYQGKDEAYAVNEIYQKMKSEVLNQRAAHAGRSSEIKTAPSQAGTTYQPNYRPVAPKATTGKRGCLTIFLIVIAIMLVMCFLGNILRSCNPFLPVGNSSGYSYYSGGDYDDGYYYWDSGNDYDDDSYSYNYDYDDDDDDNSSFWDIDWGSDWDSDSDWDYGGSWDSDSSDWGSDW